MPHPTPLLPLLLMLPLVGGLSMLVPWRFLRSDAGVRWYALAYTAVTFLISVAVLTGYDFEAAGVQYRVALTWVPDFGLSFGFGVDTVSLWLVMLTTFLMIWVVLGSFNAVSERAREFYFWLLVLEAAMVGTFIATDVIFFYICFEFTLVPLFFLIGVFGSTQRLRAAKVFFLYTFTGSMLTFAGVLYVAWYQAQQSGVWTFAIKDLVASAQTMSQPQQGWVLLALLAGFAVKVPLWPVHTWLPLAHTEAPTAGSVILAGVLLKLGTYGLLRFALPMCPDAVVAYAPVIGTLAIVGILYTALVCWVQKDIKKLIAYSSVSHLGFCVLGLFALGQNLIGPTGSVMYMINHGLSTGALFLCVGMIYERFHTREMRHYGGLAKVMPVWSFFMVFFVLASVGLPGLNGFVGEFLTLLGAFTSRSVLGPPFAAAAAVGMILAAIYLLYLVGRVVFGPVKVPGEHGGHVRDLDWREITVLTPLAVGCLVLGLYPMPVIDSMQRDLAELTGPATQSALRQNAVVINTDNKRRVSDPPASEGEARGGYDATTSLTPKNAAWTAASTLTSAETSAEWTSQHSTLPLPLPEREGSRSKPLPGREGSKAR
jgi:NADH-quinone oxidoreductase subunit M